MIRIHELIVRERGKNMTNYELYLAISKLMKLNFKILEEYVEMKEKRLSNKLEMLELKVDMCITKLNSKE